MATYYYETSTFEGNGMRNYNQTVQSGNACTIGAQSAWHSRCFRGTCRPDVSGIPSNATVISASFVMTITGFDGTTDSDIYLYTTSYGWNTNYTCWQNYTSTGLWDGGYKGTQYLFGNFFSNNASVGTVVTVPISNTSWVTDWVDGTRTNNGFIIKQNVLWTTEVVGGNYASTSFHFTSFKAYYTLVDTVGAGRASWFI
jgi:hypothetical protein